jgi:hypothetical protein
MPLIIVRMGFAEPAAASVTKDGRGRIARLIHTRNTLTQRLGLRPGMFLGLLCSHGSTLVRAFYSRSGKLASLILLVSATACLTVQLLEVFAG